MYLPWLIVSRPFLLLGIHGLHLPSFWGIQWDYLQTLWAQISFLAPMAAAGAVLASRRLSAVSMCLLAVIPAASLGIFVAKVPVQDRLLILPYAAVIFLACEFWSGILGKRARALVMGACLAIFGAMNWMHFRLPRHNHIRPAVQFLEARDAGRCGAVLVPSGGEGPWIAEFAQGRGTRLSRILVRPTKIFGEEDWNGTNWRPYYHSVDALNELLRRVPLRYCVLSELKTGRRYPHDELLESAVAGNREPWRLVYSDRDGDAGRIRIYENPRWTPALEQVALRELRCLQVKQLP
jgi:hypothetical protein